MSDNDKTRIAICLVLIMIISFITGYYSHKSEAAKFAGNEYNRGFDEGWERCRDVLDQAIKEGMLEWNHEQLHLMEYGE